MAQESYVQIAPDSTGKKVRNQADQIIQSDGSVASVLRQIVTKCDADGNPVPEQENNELLVNIWMELKAIRLCLQATYSQGAIPGSDEDFYQTALDSVNTPGEQ